MKQYFRTGGKILYDYVMSLVIFIVFLYPFIGLAKENIYTWLPLYCIIVFLFTFFLIYFDMKDLAIKEKKPQYKLNPYPLKGLIYGLVAIIPVAVAAGVLSLLHFENSVADRIRHLSVNILLGPMYFIIGWMKESFFGYVIAILVIPILAMLGYLAGHFGINIFRTIFKKKEVVQEKGFTKSPWNPTIDQKKTGKNKKKSSSGGQ